MRLAPGRATLVRMDQRPDTPDRGRGLRILAFDHFFSQDLDALQVRLGAADTLVRLPYQRLHRLARRTFPDDALTGLAAAYRGTSDAAWVRFTAMARRRTDWWIEAYRPDVFITPSDVFFYLRPVIERLRERGVPTVVVQKETTISPLVMDVHSRDVGATVPFMSDLMTVCSERQKEFWARSGADPERIVVTGQPRFDVYAAPASGASGRSRRRPRLLYLSYDDAAYLPSDLGETYEGSWQSLRRETEEAITAATDRWDVVVKHHPQQPAQPEWLGDRVRRAPQDADTRALILDADAVVGFQTTALFEAAVGDRPILYAAWGDEYERSRSLLTAFEELGGMVTHCRSGAELRAVLESEAIDLARPTAAGRAVAVEHLGPVDGKASERVLQVLAGHARRADGFPGSPAFGGRERLRAVALGGAAIAARVAAAVVARHGGTSDRLARRARDWRQEWKELAAISAGRPAAD